MSLIIPPGYAQVLIPYSHSSLARDALVTFGIQLSDTADVTMANSIMLGWADFTAGIVDDNVTMGPVVLRVGQDGGDALVVEGSVTAPGEAVSTNTDNAAVAMLVHKRTSRGGRRGRGRMYLPWTLRNSEVSEVGVVDGTLVTAVNGGLVTFLTNLGTIDGVDAMVLLHSTGESTPGLPNVVTSMTCDTRIGIQRRRIGR